MFAVAAAVLDLTDKLLTDRAKGCILSIENSLLKAFEPSKSYFDNFTDYERSLRAPNLLEVYIAAMRLLVLFRNVLLASS